METMLIGITLSLVLLLLIAVLVTLFLQFRRPQENIGDFSTAIQNLTQAIQQGQILTATLTEKVSHLEPVTQTVGSVQVELKGLSEKIAQVEQKQTITNQGIGNLESGLVQTGANITAKVSDAQQLSTTSLHQVSTGLAGELAKIQQESGAALAELKTLANGLTETTSGIRSELVRAKNDLTELQTSAKARQELEIRTAESIRRLEAIIAGTQSKGLAGENILELVFAKLPIEWQVRNFQVGGKSVEFGLRLPNNLILPIDSKWAATNLLEQFVTTSDVAEQQKLKSEIEGAVIKKAREVKKYIDPSVTVAFGVAVIPDAIYDLCSGIQTDVFQMNVVLVSYSMFIPYLLLVFQTVLRAGQSIDLQKLDAHLQTAQGSVKALQDELDGRFSRAITMLTNSRDEMRAHISKAGSSLTSLQISPPITHNVSAALPELLV